MEDNIKAGFKTLATYFVSDIIVNIIGVSNPTKRLVVSLFLVGYLQNVLETWENTDDYEEELVEMQCNGVDCGYASVCDTGVCHEAFH